MEKTKPDLREAEAKLANEQTQAHDEFYRLVAGHQNRQRLVQLWHARVGGTARAAEVRLAAAVMEVLAEGATVQDGDLQVSWGLKGIEEEAVAMLEHLLCLRRLDCLREETP